MPERPELRRLVAVPTGVPALGAVDVAGRDLAGRAKTLRLSAPGRWTLLLFLGSHCDGCLPFWTPSRAPREYGLEPQDEAIVVARGADAEDPRVLAELVGGGAGAAPSSLIMSDEAWTVYRVHGPPFFVLLDGVRVASEGVAWSVEQVGRDVARARGASAGEARDGPPARR